MPIKKISSVITVSILCANMLTFTSFADSDKNNFELNQDVNNLNINTEELQNTEDIQINSTDGENFIESKILEESIDNSSEKGQVLNALNNSDIDARSVLFEHDDEYIRKNLKGLKNKQDLSFGEPYKVVVFSKDIVDALNEESDISKAIENSPYYWEVPILNNKNKKVVSTCKVDKLENKWEVVEVGSYLDSDNAELSKNYKSISKLMKKMNIENIKDFAHIRCSLIGYDVLYAKTDTDEYFIPLSFEGNKLGKLKDKSLYDRDSFIKIVEPILETSNEDSNEVIITGIPSTNKTKSVVLEFIENIFNNFLAIFK